MKKSGTGPVFYKKGDLEASPEDRGTKRAASLRGGFYQDSTRGNEVCVLSLTEAARAHLAQVLENPEFPLGCVVRFVIEGQSVKLTLGQERPDDVSYRYQEKTVLVFDQEVAKQLEDLTLDVDQSVAEPRLKLK